MKTLYQWSLYAYQLGIRIASNYNPKAKQWIDGRKNWEEKIKTDLALLQIKSSIWFHCASLGEYEQAIPIIEAIKKQQPQEKIVISFFSPSGYEATKHKTLADYSCYLPIDSKKNAGKFIEILNVKMAFFIKYEIWYHYFTELKTREIKFYLVSSTFRRNQFLFGFFGNWIFPILSYPTKIFTQDIQSEKLLLEYNLKNVEFSGDTRFDRVNQNSLNPTKIPFIDEFKKDHKLLILGSSWREEEELLNEYLKSHFNKLKIIIAPHDISETHIIELEKKFPSAKRYSKLNESINLEFDLLIIDSIGLLSRLYKHGDIAIIGGGLKNALHNILEPATFGLAILYGNNHFKYWEAKALIKSGGAQSFSHQSSFNDLINSLINDEKFLKETQSKSKKFIIDNLGATERIISEILIKKI